jgi:rhodanese-related sulfurtransferase
MRYIGLFSVIAFLIIGCQPAQKRTTDSPVIVQMQGVSEITPAAAQPGVEAAYSQFVDVRTPEEYAAGHAYRARNIPLDTLAANLDMLEKNEPVYLICRTDNRSRKAAQILVDAGFSQAIVVVGGTEAWKAAGLPMGEPR